MEDEHSNTLFSVFSNEELYYARTENAALKSELEAQTQQIQALESQNSSLSSECESTAAFLAKFNHSWAELLGNLQNVAEPHSDYTLTDPLRYGCLLSTKEESIAQVTNFTEKVARKLISAIESLQNSKNEPVSSVELQNSLARANCTANSLSSELQQLKHSLSLKENEISLLNSKLQIHSDELSEKTSSLCILKLAAECRCLCVCGSRKSSRGAVEHPDLRSLKETSSKLTAERDYYKEQFEKLSRQKIKYQIELEVSEERFIKSRVYKKLLTDSRKLTVQIESLTMKNEELQRSKDEHCTETKNEVHKAILREESKILQLKTELETLKIKYSEMETAKKRADYENQMTREELKKRGDSHLAVRIERIESDNSRLKEQICKLKKLNGELEKKADDCNAKMMEAKDLLATKETLLDTLTHTLPPEDAALPMDDTIAEYRKRVQELKLLLKEKERKISKMEDYNRAKKNELAAEQRMKDSLMAEYEVLEKAYDEAMKRNETLTSQVNELEHNNIQLMKERVREENLKRLYTEEKLLLEDKVTAVETLATSYKELNTLSSKEKEQLESHITQLNPTLKALEGQVQTVAQANQSSLKSQEEYQSAKKSLQEKIKSVEAIYIKHATEAAQFKFLYEQSGLKVLRLEESLIKSKEILSPYEVVNSELLKYRRKFRCTLCKSRLKDTILIQCCHSFCARCIQHFIMTRSKKCPVCLVRFSVEEMKIINW